MAQRDVDYVSVKISALCAHSTCLLRAQRRPDLRRGSRRSSGSPAARPPVFVNLDMEEAPTSTSPSPVSHSRFSPKRISAPPGRHRPQAYLPRLHDVLAHLAPVVRRADRRGRRSIQIRIVRRQPGHGTCRRGAARLVQAPCTLGSEGRRELHQTPPRCPTALCRGRHAAPRRVTEPQPLRHRVGASPGDLPPAHSAVSTSMLGVWCRPGPRRPRGRALAFLLPDRPARRDRGLPRLSRPPFDENTGRDNFLARCSR